MQLLDRALQGTGAENLGAVVVTRDGRLASASGHGASVELFLNQLKVYSICRQLEVGRNAAQFRFGQGTGANEQGSPRKKSAQLSHRSQRP